MKITLLVEDHETMNGRIVLTLAGTNLVGEGYQGDNPEPVKFQHGDFPSLYDAHVRAYANVLAVVGKWGPDVFQLPPEGAVQAALESTMILQGRKYDPPQG